MPATHHSGVRIGVLAQSRVTADYVSIEFERAVGLEAARPSVRVLRVNRLAVARA